jgi:pimeloyl-ACP methyl ester carboxylesterase
MPADVARRGPPADTGVHPGFAETETRLRRSLGAAPVQRRVTLPRLGSVVRVQEVGAGPPVLFVHGGSTCGTSWADLAVRLPDRRCLLVDRPRTGLSEPLRDPIRDLDDLAALGDVLVPDILDALGLTSADASRRRSGATSPSGARWPPRSASAASPSSGGPLVRQSAACRR